MKKYFVTSDIHGFYDIFHEALLKAGFEEENPEHILIVCGDIFDRGDQPFEVYNFLRNFPKERRILIRGNHEELLEALVKREECWNHDLHNGTYQTLFKIIGKDYEEEKRKEDILIYSLWGTPAFQEKYNKYLEKRDKLEHRLYHNRKINEILKWLKSDEWVPYYELGPYIFVHAFIPTGIDIQDEGVKHIVRENWRQYGLTSREWREAAWECPYKIYLDTKDSEELKNRIVVCGHWHTSDFWNTLEDKKYNYRDFNPIFISKKYPGLIGIDACTAATYGCNVLVINEDMSLEPHNHREYLIETIMEE